MPTIRELKKTIAELRREISAYRQRLATVASLEPFAPASVEYQIARLIGGTLSDGLAAHDMVCARGKKFEVKFSRINAGTIYSKRWSWGHPLGAGGAKRFHRLILVGEVDTRYVSRYLDPKSPYVIFDVPFAAVRRLMRKDPIIQINTNPEPTSSSAAILLFARFQITRRDLKARYKAA